MSNHISESKSVSNSDSTDKLNHNLTSIGDQIHIIKNILTDSNKNMILNKLTEIIDMPYNGPFMNLLILANVPIDMFKLLLQKVDDKYIANTSYINYFSLCEINAFDYIFECLLILKKNEKLSYIYLLTNSTKFRLDVNTNYETPNNYLLEYLFHYANENNILTLWKIINDDKLQISNKCNILLTVINNYLFNKKTSDNYLYIIKQIIELYPTSINIKPFPIFNYVMMHICKLFKSYTEDEFKSIKYELTSAEIKLLDLFVNFNKDVVNYYDSNYKTPLLSSIYGNHVGACKYLLHHGADYNYTSQSGESVNIFGAALFASKEIKSLFLDEQILNNIDFSYTNTNMNNYAYIVMSYADEFDDDFKRFILQKIPNEILYEANIIKQNILHIMLSSTFKDDVMKYIDILKNKKLCWYKNDLYGDSPLTLLNKMEDAKKKIIIKQLLIFNFIKYTSKNNAAKIKAITNNDKIVKAISKLSHRKEENDIKLLTYSFNHKTNHDVGLFTSNTTHEIIYIYDIFTRYKTLGKLISEGSAVNCIATDCWRIAEFNKHYRQYPNIYNYITMNWINENAYFIPTNIFEEIKSEKKKIFFSQLAILRISGVHHANIIIFNTQYKYAVRFEPYGDVNWDEMDKFDDIFKKEMKKVLTDYEYYVPKDYLSKHVFQAVSGENDPLFTKIGDPPGYCLAWSFWFLESYLQYEKQLKNSNNLKYFVDSLYKKINNEYRSMLDYIRTYGNYLKEQEISILVDFDMPQDRLYTLMFTQSESTVIAQKINELIK